MENKSQIGLKLAVGATTFMLTVTPVIAGTVNNAYAEGIDTKITEGQYKEGTFIDNIGIYEGELYCGYVVKRGDTTSRISEKITKKYYKVEQTTKYWPVIAHDNEFPRIINPGDVIIFPASYEVMDTKLKTLKQENWVSRYIQYRGIYKNSNRNMIVGEVIDEIYGKGTSKDPTFVRKYLKAVGLDPAKYNASSELNTSTYFKLTDWIPTLGELGYDEPSRQAGKGSK